MWQIPCPKCGAAVAANEQGRLPPWCNKCGQSLARDAKPELKPTLLDLMMTNKPETPAPPAPSTPSSTAIQAEAPRPEIRRAVQPSPVSSTAIQAELPEFVSRPRFGEPGKNLVGEPIDISASLVRFEVQGYSRSQFPQDKYTIFVSNDEIFFLLTEKSNHRKRAAVSMGVLMGGLLGGMIAQALTDEKPSTWMRDLLKVADLETIREHARREENCYYYPLEEVDRVLIEAKSVWVHWLENIEHEAFITIWHRTAGKERWALRTYSDVRRAIEVLRQRIGDRLEIKLDRARYGGVVGTR